MHREPPEGASAREGGASAWAAEMESVLVRHSVRAWFPRSRDAEGGFHQDFGADWGRLPARPRSVVFQARMVWTTATLARRRPALAGEVEGDLDAWAEAGLAALVRRFVDPATGGVAFWEGRDDETHAYAVAFVIYAAAAVHRATGSAESRRLALGLFAWLDGGAWRPDRDGYVEALRLDGTPCTGHPTRKVDLLGIPWGATSSNAHIHLIEALTELLVATGHPGVGARLEAMVRRLESVAERDRARVYRVYDERWTPIDRARSFGHDVEAFHLAATARAALGLDPDGPLERLARRALAEGLDRRFGGLLEGRRPYRFRPDTRKLWWAQAEALNALARLASRDPDSPEPFARDLGRLWAFVRDRMLDEAHGGWIEIVSRRGDRVLRPHKAGPWKAAYHEVRSLLDAADVLAGAIPA